MGDPKSPFLTQRHSLAEDAAVIVVAAMVFEGDEAMFPGCLMYHRDRPDGTSQALVPVRAKRSAAEMNDPLDPVASKFWVTSLPATARMGGRDHAVVAGICVSEPPREPGTVQLALMVSGVATIQAAQSLGADPTPGELLAVVAEGGPPKKHTLKARRFLPPEACFLAHWPSHISASDVFGDSGTDPFGPVLTALRTPGATISDFTGDKSRSVNNAVTYLSYMAGEDPGTVYSYLTDNRNELEMYAVPSGAFARVLDTGPNNTLRVLVSGML